jgi:hypothetical protein
MDPITTAIVAAVPAIAAGLVTDAVKDAYAGLKAILTRKWGAASAVGKALGELEAHPDSQPCKTMLQKEISRSKANDDVEVLRAVEKLVDALKAAGATTHDGSNVAISGGTVQGIVGAHNVNVGTISFGSPSNSRKSSLP